MDKLHLVTPASNPKLDEAPITKKQVTRKPRVKKPKVEEVKQNIQPTEVNKQLELPTRKQLELPTRKQLELPARKIDLKYKQVYGD